MSTLQHVLDVISLFSFAHLLVYVFGLTLLYNVFITLDNICFHPLRHFPGPKLNALSHWPYWLSHFRLQGHLDSKKLHEQYGPVVRIAPDRLEFDSEQAWKDIHGYGAMGSLDPSIEKDYGWYEPVKPPTRTILTARGAEHTRFRRIMNLAFSTTALKEQEPIMQRHINVLMSGLQDASAVEGLVDLCEWFQKELFDATGDLALGESFGLLDARRQKTQEIEHAHEEGKEAIDVPVSSGHDTRKEDLKERDARQRDLVDEQAAIQEELDSNIPKKKQKSEEKGIDEVLASLRGASMVHGILGYRAFQALIAFFVKIFVFFSPANRLERDLTQKVKRRLKAVGESDEHVQGRRDIAWYLMKKPVEEKAAMTDDEMVINLVVLLVAGAETTAVLVTVATWLLLIHPAQLNRLVTDLRASFSSPADLTLTTVNNPNSPIATTLDAIIQETLRLFPPSPLTLPRITRRPCVVDSFLVPTNTLVGVNPYASARCARSWTKPDEFHPERWLKAEDVAAEFVNDAKAANQPFSTGPRDCLGRRLAFFQAKLLLARLFFEFDVVLLSQSRRWISNQKWKEEEKKRKKNGEKEEMGRELNVYEEDSKTPRLELYDASWAKPPMYVTLRKVVCA